MVTVMNIHAGFQLAQEKSDGFAAVLSLLFLKMDPSNQFMRHKHILSLDTCVAETFLPVTMKTSTTGNVSCMISLCA